MVSSVGTQRMIPSTSRGPDPPRRGAPAAVQKETLERRVVALGEQWITVTLDDFVALEQQLDSVGTHLFAWPDIVAAWPDAQLHDYFNIFSIGSLCLLTCGAGLRQSLNLPLALAIFAYVLVDTVWLKLKPHLFPTPRMVMFHHCATLVVAGHAATWAPHVHFTSQMAVVEFSTLILMLKRFCSGSTLKLLDLAFKVSWVATRVVWLPCLAVLLSLRSDWPSVSRRVLCSGCAFGLAALQWVWTVRGEPAPKPEAPLDGSDTGSARG